MTESPVDPRAGGVRIRYFMLRLQTHDGDEPRLAGLVEYLATGEKVRFGSGDELLRIVAGWSVQQPPEPAAPRTANHPVPPVPAGP